MKTVFGTRRLYSMVCIVRVVMFMAKPIPIPDLSAKAWEAFERDIKNGPTELQKQMIKEGLDVYDTIKRES